MRLITVAEIVTVTIISILLLFPELVRAKWFGIEIRYVLAFAYILVGIFKLVNRYRDNREQPEARRRRQLTAHLRVFLKNFEENLGTKYQGMFRCNIMVEKDEALTIFAYYGPYQREELKARWPLGVGVCGLAFVMNKPLFCDLTSIQEADSFDDIRNQTGQPEYGLSPDLWGRTRHVKCVISFPLHDLHGSKKRPWGVLNVDSTLKSVPKFLHSKIRKFVEIYKEVLEICYLE